MDSPENIIGRGMYSVPQAARLLLVSQSTLRYWLGERGDAASIIHRQFPTDDLLTFAELMELHFIKMFRDENVTFQAIRKAAQIASTKYHADYPFTVKRFDTDGRTIFATLKSKETDKTLVEDLAKGQLVFGKIIRPFFKKLDYGPSNDIGLYWPLRTSKNKTGRIVLDPTRRYGTPIDAETGVPTDVLAKAVAAGNGQEAIKVARWFDVPLEAVKAAVRFENSLAT